MVSRFFDFVVVTVPECFDGVRVADPGGVGNSSFQSLFLCASSKLWTLLVVTSELNCVVKRRDNDGCCGGDDGRSMCPSTGYVCDASLPTGSTRRTRTPSPTKTCCEVRRGILFSCLRRLLGETRGTARGGCDVDDNDEDDRRAPPRSTTPTSVPVGGRLPHAGEC